IVVFPVLLSPISTPCFGRRIEAALMPRKFLMVRRAAHIELESQIFLAKICSANNHMIRSLIKGQAWTIGSTQAGDQEPVPARSCPEFSRIWAHTSSYGRFHMLPNAETAPEVSPGQSDRDPTSQNGPSVSVTMRLFGTASIHCLPDRDRTAGSLTLK